ncbi:sigma factor [Actinoplanes sp. NPDC051346]|uniref:sigma factor n=1 Tax=Actinoplanes sp. NPDC051346 TaxID=3155048 RepID=UPI0034256999
MTTRPRPGGVRGDLEAVFRSAYPRVVAVAARVLGARDEAEDVAQEVFLTFARSSVPAGEATGWLSVAAAHLALNHLRSGRRRAAREGSALFRYQPWLTAAEVLALHVRLAGTAVPARDQRECLGTVGLADRAGDRVGGFSKGMQQRLGMAVALVARPELVVLDEPTSALDPIGRADVRDLLLALKDRGVAVLLNSHLIGEVERVCDRVVILDKGRVAASGTLDELLGGRELRLRLDAVSAPAEARLAAAGRLTRSGDAFTVELPAEPDATTVPDLVADLVGLGVRVHAVEPARISLEERLLDILRTGPSEEQR